MDLAHDYFQENLALLQKHHPEVWNKVMAYDEKPLGEFCLAGDGKINLLVHGKNDEEVFIHDPTTPEAELEGFYGLVPEDSTGVVFFVGMGLGYSPLAMIENRRQIRHLAVLEPVPGIFVQALHAMDLKPLITDRRVVIGLGPEIDVADVTTSMQKALMLESIHILNHLPSSKLNLPAYQGLYDEIYKRTNTSNVGGSTTRTFGRKFIENRLRHVSAIHHQHLLEHLKDSFAGVPAFIVAGGPSLNKNIHLLPEAKGKAVIIAVDTVLPALLKHGVTPDFTTAIDMQDIVLEKIVDVSAAATETALVCASWVNPTIPKNFPARQVYWTFAARPMEQWLSTLLGGKVLTTGAGTVAHLSFTTAVWLGCSPIIFVGQDLAYTDQQDHAAHTSLTQKDDLEKLYAMNAIMWVDGYGGRKVPTTRGWLSDKHHFEWGMAVTPDRKFINATEGGIRLEGAEEIPLQETLSQYCRQDIDLAGAIRDAEASGKMADRRLVVDEFGRFLKSIAGVEKDMERLEGVIAKISREVKALRKKGGAYYGFDSLPITLKRQVSELDVLNGRLDRAKPWALLEEVTLNGLQQSERLYHEIKSLEDKPEHYLEYIAKSVERFVVINTCRRQELTSFKQQLKQLHAYLQGEEQLLKRLAKAGDDSQTAALDLLRLYHGNGDYILMEKFIAAHCPEHAESAELSFYLGAIAAYQSQFEKAEQCFSRAVQLDPAWSGRIDECRQGLGDQYLRYAQEWQEMDRDVARRMLFKGIRHCLAHSALGEALSVEAAQVRVEAEAAASQGALAEKTDRLAPWCRELSANANLGIVIGSETAASLCRLYGNALVARQEYAKAIEAFATASSFASEAPDLYLLQADAFFAMQDFTKGVACLDRAVTLDRNYAMYWQNMGDNLLATGKPADALAAYEKCFTSLPGEIGLLKKMGDCYLALEQPEAAMEAYQQFKVRMLQPAPGQQDGAVEKAV